MLARAEAEGSPLPSASPRDLETSGQSMDVAPAETSSRDELPPSTSTASGAMGQDEGMGEDLDALLNYERTFMKELSPGTMMSIELESLKSAQGASSNSPNE